MFLLSLIPTSWIVWAVDAMLGVGAALLIAGYVLSLLRKSMTAGVAAVVLQVLGTATLAGGLYFKGGSANELAHRENVERLEKRIQESEAKSDDLNTQLVAALKSKQKTVKEVQFIVQEKIVEVAGKIDSKCTVDPVAVELLNDAARNSVKKR